MKVQNLAIVFAFLMVSVQSAHAYGYGGGSYDRHDMNQISVDGQFSRQQQQYAPQRQESPSDRLRQKRAQLEQQNERMVQERIEEIRYEKELILMKQMEETMNQTLDAIGTIGR